MSLVRLGATRFRNLQDVSLNPSPGINLLVGDNGSGKTSLLEAAYFLTSARSFRDVSSEPLISRDAEDCLVTGLVEDRGVQFSLGIHRSRDGDRDIRINGEKAGKASSLARLLPVQVLGPDSVDLLLGPPTLRRRFLNWGLFHVEPSFQNGWEEANRCLKQRNLMLRQAIQDEVAMRSWTDLLVQQAVRIDAQRSDYMSRIEPVFREISERLLQMDEVGIQYFRGWDRDRELSDVYHADIEMDKKRGYSQKGFQRADVRITVGGQPAAKVCSRGELKSLVWSLMFAQGELIQTYGESDSRQDMLYLIDDLASEFDSEHRQRVCQFLADTGQQVLLTGVDGELLLEALEGKCDRMFHVKHGQIAKDR